MPTGSLLLEFELGPGEELRICSDGLAGMFPSFDVRGPVASKPRGEDSLEIDICSTNRPG